MQMQKTGTRLHMIHIIIKVLIYENSFTRRDTIQCNIDTNSHYW